MYPTRRSLIAAVWKGGARSPGDVSLDTQSAARLFPSKPIRIVVPYRRADRPTASRVLRRLLSSKLGQTVVVENKGRRRRNHRLHGGQARGARRPHHPVHDSSSLIQNRVTVKDLPYDPEKDFTYLTMTTSNRRAVLAAEKTGAQTASSSSTMRRRSTGEWAPTARVDPARVIESMARQYGFKVEVVQYRGEAAMFAK